MNRLLLLCLITTVCAWPTRAQQAPSYGVKVGLSSSEYRFDGTSLEPRLGGNAGIFVTDPLGGSFQMLYEVNYHQKGLSSTTVRGVGEEQFIMQSDVRYDYASLLIGPHYANTLGSGKVKLYGFLGARADVRVLAREAYIGPDGERVVETIESDRLKRFIFGVSGGLGLDLSEALSIPILVEFRYNGDITPAFSFERGISGGTETLTARHRTIDFRIGFLF